VRTTPLRGLLRRAIILGAGEGLISPLGISHPHEDRLQAEQPAPSEERFRADEVQQAAVLQHLAVAGEAINRLSPELRRRHPRVAWQPIWPCSTEWYTPSWPKPLSASVLGASSCKDLAVSAEVGDNRLDSHEPHGPSR
jgi:hypothetical protein